MQSKLLPKASNAIPGVSGFAETLLWNAYAEQAALREEDHTTVCDFTGSSANHK